MIEVNQLAKYYGDFCAVSDISFSAKKGEIVGFLGPNGAGKTTTLRMLSTYLPPSRGSARIAGYDIQKQSDAVRKCIGYLPETPPLYDELTVQEYLTFVARIKGLARKECKIRVAEIIEKCFLTDVTSRLCGHLSRGYRQRTGLAQAIIHQPEVIILDEPTGGLDPKQIIEIRKLIAALAIDHTVILSTHILSEVNMICNKVVIINGGQIVLEQDLAELKQQGSLEQIFLATVSEKIQGNERGLAIDSVEEGEGVLS